MIGVSCQTISKWDQQINCPDIMILPEIARIFGITIDELFGIKREKEIVFLIDGDTLWNNDWKWRMAIYCGRKLLKQEEIECTEGNNIINFHFHKFKGQYNLNGICKVNCSKED